MRRNTNNQSKLTKNVAIAGAVCAGIAVIIIGMILFFKLKSNGNDVIVEEETGMIEEYSEDFESASTEMGKTVEEAENEVSTTLNENTVSKNETNQALNESNTSNKTSNTNSTVKSEKIQEVEKENKEENKEVTFTAPVKGEILREFAADSLVYSDTLEEWITHKGIDIKADKTTVVTAACDGTVQSIKNDPRYGLTVIINHDGGYQTVYSNLLTAEFVVEGEKVTQGQTIGTVGNSASFEINDSYHLHFELLKNNEYVDPTIYMDFE